MKTPADRRRLLFLTGLSPRLSSDRPRPGLRRLPASPLRSLLCLLSIAALCTGCGARLARHNIVDRVGIQVDLVREVKGFATRARGFEHPAIISSERLTNILNAIEVETPEKSGGVIRAPAFHAEIVPRTADALAEALAEAGPDEEVGVSVVRKQMRLGVFHSKFLTSFLAHIQDGHLYIFLDRVEWPIPQAQEGDDLPKPRHGYRPMRHRVVTGEHLFYAGPQTLEITWQDPVFRTPYRLPGSTQGEAKRREVILRAPIPQDERNAADADAVSLDQLTPEQLRALADLEEDRREGRITETAYQRARRQLLRQR